MNVWCCVLGEKLRGGCILCRLIFRVFFFFWCWTGKRRGMYWWIVVVVFDWMGKHCCGVSVIVSINIGWWVIGRESTGKYNIPEVSINQCFVFFYWMGTHYWVPRCNDCLFASGQGSTRKKRRLYVVCPFYNWIHVFLTHDLKLCGIHFAVLKLIPLVYCRAAPQF